MLSKNIQYLTENLIFEKIYNEYKLFF